MTHVAIARPIPVRGHRLRASLSLLSGALFGLLLGGAVAIALATSFFGFSIVTVTSGSMAPAIRAGEAAVVRPAGIDDVRAGDVVLFEQGGEDVPVLHRVAGINEVETHITSRSTGRVTTVIDRRLVTWGDANPAPDPEPVTADALRGRVWFTIPGAGAFLGLPLQGVLLLAAGAFGFLWLLSATWQQREGRKAAKRA